MFDRDDKNFKNKLKFASADDTPVEILKELSCDRSLVTSLTLFERLITIKNSVIRELIAKNNHAPEEIIEELARDRDIQVRLGNFTKEKGESLGLKILLGENIRSSLIH